MLRFTQDFRKDLEAFGEAFHRGEPFALARFADGEWKLCAGKMTRTDKAHETWWSHRHTTEPRRLLLAALRYASPSYYVGISSSCYGAAASYLRGQVRVRKTNLTFATLFCHSNYDAFLELDLRKGSVLVSSAGGDFAVPKNAVNEEWDIDGLHAELAEVDRPILVAAGPAACWIVHRYWSTQPPERRQIIVDVGAAYDPEIHGENTRAYHAKDNGWRRHSCKW